MKNTINENERKFLDDTEFLDNGLTLIYVPDSKVGSFTKLREYCKENNIKPSDLTKEEMESFGFSY